MTPRRMFRADVAAVTILLLIAATYATLYMATLMPGVAMTSMINPAKGIRTFHARPAYRRPQFLSVEWADTIERVLSPAHRLDRLLRPKRWPRDRTVLMDAAELQRMIGNDEDASF